MGNQVGVCREPPQLSDLFSQQNNASQGGKSHDRHSIQDDGFKSYLQLWRFYSDSADDVVIKNSPVRFAQFKKFESKDCYIALHVIKNIMSEGKIATSPRAVESPRNNTHNTSLFDLLTSSMEELTPRGTSCSFGTLSLEPFIHNTTEEYTHDLYVWNGKNSSSLAKAVALAKGFEIERVLTQDKHTGALMHHFAKTPKAALSAHFIDDLATYKEARLQFDIRKYENNHIFKQLVGTNKKTVSTVKIGELFGSPSEGPRYEVLKKLVHSQPNGLVATKISEPATKYSSKVPPITKIPSFTPPTKEPLTPHPTHTNAPQSLPIVPTLTIPSSSTTSTSTAPTSTAPLSLSSPAPTPTPGVVKVPSLKLQSNNSSETLGGLLPKASSDRSLRVTQDLASESSEQRDYSPRKTRGKFEAVLSRILDYLYLGGQKPAMDRVALRETGITHILNCAGGACRDYFPDEFVYKTYHIGDGVSEDITCLFYESLEFIEDAVRNHGKVLIHCHQGISRSSAFVICYLMWKNKWGFMQAHEFTKEGRDIANPNSGFIGQLLQWRNFLDEEKHKREIRMFRVMRHSKNTLIVPKKVTPGFPALDPRGCFILHTPSALYYWIGKESSPAYVEAAHKIIAYMRKYEDAPGVIVEVHQGSEPNDFWESIGGPGPVSEVPSYSDYAEEEITPANKSSLFVYKNTGWVLSKVKDRESLLADMIYLLQTPSTLYLWVGENAKWDTTTERSLAGEAAAKDFIYSHYSNTQDTPPPVVVLTDRSNEDQDFLSYFTISV